MSGSIFGDDDDFELVGGSDTPSAIRKPPPKANPAARPVAPRTPSAPVPASSDSKNTGNRAIPTVTSASSLPRPQLPMPANKEVPARRTLPNKLEQIKPTQERVQATKQPATPVRETAARDTTRPEPTAAASKDIPTVATAEHRQSSYTPVIEERPVAEPSPSRYIERDHSELDSVLTSRRDARANPNDYEDFFPKEKEHNPTSLHEETPKRLYSQTPYTPAENTRSEPSRIEQRNVEQPLQSYPDSRRSPVAEPPREEIQPSPVKSAKASRSAKPKREKASKAKGPSSFSGGRAGVVVVRVFAITVVAILMFAGGKSIFFPPQIPDPTTVTNVVKKRLGVTNFPIDSGKAFVTSFAKIYLTVDPANPNSNDVFVPYMNSSLAANMTSSNGNESKQIVTEGPIISGVKSVDDSNAIYTVAARLNSATNWVYVNVPVYYDGDSVGFAVSGMPAFAPAPTKITAPPAGSPFEQDTKLAAEIKTSVMEQFFPAWASSNTAGINLIVLESANSEAKIGLANSVKFVSIQAFTVEQKQPDAADENTRKAQATIVWASPTDAKITYTQQYSLTLFRQPDNRWYIKELTSGVRS